MALSAITVANTDHFAKGGIKKLTLGVYDGTTLIDINTAEQTAVNSTLVLGADSQVIDFEKETAKMSVSGSQEKGLMMFTVSIECYIPKIDNTRFKGLQAMVGQALCAKVEGWDDTSFIVGFDGVLGDENGGAAGATTDFALFLESIEADSGAGLADQNGVTLKLTSVQGALPYTLQ
tara:strand:- start:1121 stop:1651 length:531 start_codon:yes stop_codon:yes gene_type:complete